MQVLLNTLYFSKFEKTLKNMANLIYLLHLYQKIAKLLKTKLAKSDKYGKNLLNYEIFAKKVKYGNSYSKIIKIKNIMQT